MDLKEEAQKIQDFAEITCSNNPEEVKERIADLSVYLARTSQMLADAKLLYSKKVSSEISEKIINKAKGGEKLSATSQNKLVNTFAEDEKHLVDWIERLNKTCTHQIDALRSVLSYEREQLRLSQIG